MISRRTVTLGLGMGGLLLLVPGITAALRGCAAINRPIPFVDVRELSSHARIEFPPGARILESERFGALNVYGYARVEIPADGLESFLAQPTFAGKTTRNNSPPEESPIEPFYSPKLVESWQLSRIRRSISAQVGALNSPNERSPLQLFLSLDDPKHPIAHLHWYN